MEEIYCYSMMFYAAGPLSRRADHNNLVAARKAAPVCTFDQPELLL
ncbi:MAG: hypothetical protein WAN35_11615 [Terracidiphilus sp.]